MTNEEALKMFKSIIIAEIDRLPYHYDEEVDYYVYDDTSRVDELLQLNKIVSKTLEKADKYRWHDLRESPYDLPRVTNGYGESDYLLVKTERCDTEIACYSYIKKQWSIDSYVFAWRYIEPFESDER